MPATFIHAPWFAEPEELAQAGFVLGRDYPQPSIDHAKAGTLARYEAAGASEEN